MMNRTVLVGRLTKDVDLRYTPNGVATASFTLAVNRAFANQQGEREADFIKCVVWRKQAENAAKYLSKGSLAGVDGQLRTRNYEGNDGKRVYVTEVLVELIQFLEPKKDGKSNNESGYANQGGNGNPRSFNPNNDDPFSNIGQPIDISNDDLPF